MTIQPMSQTGGAPAPGSSGTTSSSNAGTVAENQFLQLLVAQLKHQDPTNPTDGTTFVTQLAQFSQLEQMIAIRSDIESQMTNTAAQTGGTTKGGY